MDVVIVIYYVFHFRYLAYKTVLASDVELIVFGET